MTPDRSSFSEEHLELPGVIRSWRGGASGAIGSNRELMQSDKGFDKGSNKGGDPPASDFRRRSEALAGQVGAASPASLGATARRGGWVDCADWSGLVGIGRVWSGLVRFGPVWSGLVRFGPVWCGLLSEFCFLLR